MTKDLKRYCYICGTEIKESFGLVKAGDFLRFIESKIKHELTTPHIRDTCFKCSFFKMDVNELKKEMDDLERLSQERNKETEGDSAP